MSFNFCVKCMVAAYPDIVARVYFCTPLSDKNRSCFYVFAVMAFNT